MKPLADLTEELTNSLDAYLRNFISGVIVSTGLYEESLSETIDDRDIQIEWDKYNLRVNTITDWLIKYDIIDMQSGR